MNKYLKMKLKELLKNLRKLSNISALFLSLITLFAEEESELIFLDGIAVIHVGESGITPIYYSDGWFLSPFGSKKTLEESIIRSIWTKYGYEHGIKVTSAEILEAAEKQLEFLQEQKNISRAKIEKMAEELGYTLDDVKRELGSQMLMQKTLEMSFAANGYLNVSNEEIVDQYTIKPPRQEASFALLLGVERDDRKEKIIWEESPLIINKADLSEKFRKIEEYSIGEIVYAEHDEKKKATIHYKLIDKKEEKIFTFEESYEEIYKKLQNQKFSKSYQDMTSSFLNSSLTLYYDTESKQKCFQFLANENSSV